jgi:porin
MLSSIRRFVCVVAVISSPAAAQHIAPPLASVDTHSEPIEKAEDQAFSFGVTYTADVTSLVSGGVKQETRYLDNLDVIATTNFERAIGWKGATASAYILYNNGARFSPLVGDAFVTSNIETGARALRLYEARVEQ